MRGGLHHRVPLSEVREVRNVIDVNLNISNTVSSFSAIASSNPTPVYRQRYSEPNKDGQTIQGAKIKIGEHPVKSVSWPATKKQPPAKPTETSRNRQQARKGKPAKPPSPASPSTLPGDVYSCRFGSCLVARRRETAVCLPIAATKARSSFPSLLTGPYRLGSTSSPGSLAASRNHEHPCSGASRSTFDGFQTGSGQNIV